MFKKIWMKIAAKKANVPVPAEGAVKNESFEIVSLGKVADTTFGGGRTFEDNGVINSRTM